MNKLKHLGFISLLSIPILTAFAQTSTPMCPEGTPLTAECLKAALEKGQNWANNLVPDKEEKDKKTKPQKQQQQVYEPPQQFPLTADEAKQRLQKPVTKTLPPSNFNTQQHQNIFQ